MPAARFVYTGRLTAVLPEAVRLLIFKADGSVLVHDDAGGFKPLNWMTPPTVVEEQEDRIVVRKRAGKSEDLLEIRVTELLSDVTHDMGESAALQKDGVERHLQEELAAQPAALAKTCSSCGGSGRPTSAPSTSCAATRRATGSPSRSSASGRSTRSSSSRATSSGSRSKAVAASSPRQVIKPQARTLAEARGIHCVEVDLAVLRGEREPELTLFAD